MYASVLTWCPSATDRGIWTPFYPPDVFEGLFRNNLVGQAPMHGGLLFAGVSCVTEYALYVLVLWDPSCHAVKIQRTFADHSLNIHCTFPYHLMNLEWTFSSHSANWQCGTQVNSQRSTVNNQQSTIHSQPFVTLVRFFNLDFNILMLAVAALVVKCRVAVFCVLSFTRLLWDVYLICGGMSIWYAASAIHYVGSCGL